MLGWVELKERRKRRGRRGEKGGSWIGVGA
jgi:hypothetical protein